MCCRYFRELRPAPELPPGYVGLERRLAGLLTRPQQRRVDLTYLTKDHSSWVLHVPGWHPVGAEDFEAMWALHPPSLGRNSFQGRSVATPRYFQAFGRSYSFSGQVAEALPLSRVPLAETARQRIKALLLELGPCSDEAAGVRPAADCGDGRGRKPQRNCSCSDGGNAPSHVQKAKQPAFQRAVPGVEVRQC